MNHTAQVRFADAYVSAATVRDYLISDLAAPKMPLALDGGVVIGEPDGNDQLGDILHSLRTQRPDCDWVGLGRFTEPIAADRLLYLSRLGMRAIGYDLGANEIAAPYDVQSSAALAFELANCPCDIHIADDILQLATPAPGIAPLPGLLTEIADLLVSLPAATLVCTSLAAYPPQFLRELAHSGVNIKVTGASFLQGGNPIGLLPQFLSLIDGMTERFMLGSGTNIETSAAVLPQIVAAIEKRFGTGDMWRVANGNAQRWYRLGASPSGRTSIA